MKSNHILIFIAVVISLFRSVACVGATIEFSSLIAIDPGSCGYVVLPAIAAGPDGSIYVTESSQCLQRIQKFSASGELLLTWGSYGSGDGQLSLPDGFAFDPYGNVYVSEDWNSRYQKFTNQGSWLSRVGEYGSGDVQFKNPKGIATDSSGNVYLADSGNCRVQKLSPSGGMLAQWGTCGSGEGQFSAMEAIAVDGSGNVFVADSGNSRISRFSSAGAFLGAWGSAGSGDGQFQSPVSLAVAPTGNIFVVDKYNDRIEEFSSEGLFLGQWPVLDPDTAAALAPSGIAVAANGALLVADAAGKRILLGTFATKGSLQVTLTPADAVAAGARWRLDDGTWQESGAIMQAVTAGSHTVSFNAIAGWRSPAAQTVTISPDQAETRTAAYSLCKVLLPAIVGLLLQE